MKPTSNTNYILYVGEHIRRNINGGNSMAFYFSVLVLVKSWVVSKIGFVSSFEVYRAFPGVFVLRFARLYDRKATSICGKKRKIDHKRNWSNFK